MRSHGHTSRHADVRCPHRAHLPRPVPPPCPQHSRAAAAQLRQQVIMLSDSLYSFAKVETKVVSRKMRGHDKRQAMELKDIVYGMCSMTEKQLQAVIPVCGEKFVAGVRIAASLPRSNQGRKRQESYLIKILRTHLDEAAVAKLQEAVTMSRTSMTAYVDESVTERVEDWREGLRQGDKDVMTDVLARLAAARGGQSGPSDTDTPTESDNTQGDDTAGSDDEISDSDTEAGMAGSAQAPAASSAPALPSPQEFRTLIRTWRQAADAAEQARAAAQASALAATGSFLSGSEDSSEPVPSVLPGTDASKLAATAEVATKRTRKLAKKVNAVLKQLASMQS